MSIFSTPDTYLITITYCKHGGNYYPKGPKSRSPKGIEISNQWIQQTVTPRNKETLLEDIYTHFKKSHPYASNFKIESITKL